MTACWGSTFFLIKDLLERVPTLDFLAVRFAIASVVLLLVAPRAVGAAVPRDPQARGSCWACSTASRRSCRPPGWRTPPASVSGFITGMYVVAHAAVRGAAAAHPDHRG